MTPATHTTQANGEANQEAASSYFDDAGWLQACPGFMAIGDDAWLKGDRLVVVSTSGVSLYRNQAHSWGRIGGEVGFPSGAMGGFLVEAMGAFKGGRVSPGANGGSCLPV